MLPITRLGALPVPFATYMDRGRGTQHVVRATELPLFESRASRTGSMEGTSPLTPKLPLRLQYYDTSRLFVSSCESQLLLMFVPLTHRLCRTTSSLMLCFLCREITPKRWVCRRIFGGVSQRCSPFRGIDRVSCVFESTSTKLQLNRFLV